MGKLGNCNPRSGVLYLDHVTDDDMPAIHLDGPELVYVLVASHLAARIAAGEFQPGARLPPERELANFYGVAYDTIRRANGILRERGLIVTVHGRGTFVARKR